MNNMSKIKKDPALAAVLSFLFTGAGQIYVGKVGSGIAFMIAQIINVCLMAILIGFITTPITAVWCIWDAYNQAKEVNRE